MPETNAVFRIDIDESRNPLMAYGEKCLPGTLQIHDFTENFSVPVEIWGAADYRRQWREGIERCLAGTFPSCLVTGMRDPKQGVFINILALYVDPDNAGNIAVQRKLLSCKQIRRRFASRSIYDFCGSREIMTHDGEPIPEWIVSRNELAEFLKALKPSEPGA